MSDEIPTIEGIPATNWTPFRSAEAKRLLRLQRIDCNIKKSLDDGVELVQGSSLKPEPIQWLWEGWLPLGKLIILAGEPGTGKTTTALNFAAQVTAGGAFPDGSTCPEGDVLIWSGEDDPSDTLLPRLQAAGAKTERIFFVGDRSVTGERRPFDPSTDTAELMKATKQLPNLQMIIFDPVVNAVAGDSHKNTEVRRALQPLVDIAAQVGAVLIGITHFSKAGAGQDPTTRVIGSVAFSAVARVVLVCAKINDKDGTERRILARSKSNLGPDDGGYSYTLDQVQAYPGIWASKTFWGEALTGSAKALLAQTDESLGTAQIFDVASLLREELTEDCWTNAKEVTQSIVAHGFSAKQVWSASRRLGVIRKPGGYQGAWYWRLPGGPDPGLSMASSDSSDSTFQKRESLESLNKSGITGEELPCDCEERGEDF